MRVSGTMALTVALREVDGADAAQRSFVERAIGRLQEAVAHPGFLPAVAQADYVETRWTPLHGPWRVLTGEEIADRIGSGIERGSEADGVLEFAFELVDLPGPDSGHPTLGSTALGCQPILTSRWFVDRCAGADDAVNLASHFMHEWMHLSGFFHWPDNKARGDTAYVVGRLVREVLEPRHGAEIDASITALMHDRETDCGCRGNPEGGVAVGQPPARSPSTRRG
jgi:hypothetical protein